MNNDYLNDIIRSKIDVIAYNSIEEKANWQNKTYEYLQKYKSNNFISENWVLSFILEFFREVIYCNNKSIKLDIKNKFIFCFSELLFTNQECINCIGGYIESKNWDCCDGFCSNCNTKYEIKTSFKNKNSFYGGIPEGVNRFCKNPDNIFICLTKGGYKMCKSSELEFKIIDRITKQEITDIEKLKIKDSYDQKPDTSRSTIIYTKLYNLDDSYNILVKNRINKIKENINLITKVLFNFIKFNKLYSSLEGYVNFVQIKKDILISLSNLRKYFD